MEVKNVEKGPKNDTKKVKLGPKKHELKEKRALIFLALQKVVLAYVNLIPALCLRGKTRN